MTWFVSVMMVLAAASPEKPDVLNVSPLAPRIEHVTFRSRVLNQDKAFSVVLPEAYDRDDRAWPMLVILHGRGRHERSLVDDPVAQQALLEAPFVVILPDGDDGWYIDSPVRRQDRYGAYLQEVLDVANSRYRLSRERERRGVAGWSMGGYGAVRFAQEHPESFGAVASIIGLLDFPRVGLPEGQSYPVPTDRFGDDPDTWMNLNPIASASRLRDMNILLITGKRAFDRTMNEHFAARLRELEIPFRWRQLSGGHTFGVVREAIPLVVTMMAEVLVDQPREESADP